MGLGFSSQLAFKSLGLSKPKDHERKEIQFRGEDPDIEAD